MAAIADQCGCRAIPVEEKINAEETEEEASIEEGYESPEKAEEKAEEVAEEEETSEQGEQAEAPTIELEIYEGPLYSQSDNICFCRIKANVTGTPSPNVEFSRDDSDGA
ncbi:MAG: hypothetical protein MUO59_07935 [Actinobacteria bacterium]|nr:hypothetical protein [Actinomycetota bacterium]